MMIRSIKQLLITRARSFVNDSWKVNRDYIKVHPSAIVAPGATVKIYNPPDPPSICLEIGEDSHIFSSFSIIRPQARITIGKRCQLGASHFVCVDSIEVQDDVIMSWGITVIDSDNHAPNWSDRKMDVLRCKKDYLDTNGHDLARTHDWSRVKTERVVIQNKVLIGFGASILKGVTIGEGAVIGAGSVVTRDVKPWHVGAGNPFRHIRALEDQSHIKV